MSILVCGSLAFDTIMTFEGRFAEQILPSQLHILNVSFLVPGLRREYGGCAGNIAYGLRQLGAQAVPLAMLGNDGQDYLARLQALGVDTQHVGSSADCYTAQAMIMTDRDNNQITAFHPGAMSQAHDNPVPARTDISLGIISPDGREAMLSHARQLHAAGVPFVFDPGQGLPMFNGEELLQFVELATWVAVNDYEARMLSDRTGFSLEDLAARVQGLIVTLGAQGCEVWEGGQKTVVPGLSVADVVDPTGCGDAFRAALLHGLELGWALQRCAELGNRMGAAKIASRGGQNYLFSVQPRNGS
ncbi:MAG: carbohydrate kinase family protein [Hydrogenophaga sp.]|uniref:carbohydrate kinase family protein n=1 Tax=Hydrogenophaga sp. TaxID=1904254 RepID=UPI0027281500|nr:carbohydrate kinase family protein [Hydrogenophaga sp.]MDO9568152.1 carbohydrate kinase family protein [Hydrogenophaga sp.]MDP3376177.1 carbohydrate kinase family protein [Hydrogenophaga sp.]